MDTVGQQGILEPEISPLEASIQLASLTSKQVEVLDRLIQHKTSKEIALELDISPHTVDQRITFAKTKLEAESRGELANRYSELLRICHQTIYEDSHLSFPAIPLDIDRTNKTEAALAYLSPERMDPCAGMDAEDAYADIREAPGAKTGVVKSFGLVVAMMVGLSLSVAGGLAIFIQLSELFAR